MINSIVPKLAAVGLTTPEAIQAIEDFNAALTAAAAHPVDLRPEILAGKISPATAGKWLSTAALQRVTSAAMVEIHRELSGTLEKAMSAAIRESAPQILIALRVPFDQAAAGLALAADQFGPRPDHKAILGAGPAAMASWESRKRAVALMNKVRSVRMALANAAHWGPPTQGPSWYLAALRDIADLDNAARLFASGGIEALAANGYALNLNTLDQIEAITSHAQTVTDEQEAARQTEAMVETRKWAEREVDDWKKTIRGGYKPKPAKVKSDADA